MIRSMALIFFTGLVMSLFMQKIHLPRLLGFLLTGIILGPCCLSLIDKNTLMISQDLRTVALIIILVKAGLSLDMEDLKKVGRPAFLMSFLPASFEIAAYFFLAPTILGMTRLEGLLLGAVLGAVSPAVVVPYMVRIMEEGYGNKKGIPQLILAGSSLDDVYTIVLFSTFLSMMTGSKVSASDFMMVPVKIILGVAAGYATGKILTIVFEYFFKKDKTIRNSMKVIVILNTAFFLKYLESIIPISGLLAVIVMAITVQKIMPEVVGDRLSSKFGKLWLAAEVLLFVLVGAEVNILSMFKCGISGILIILAALLIRMIGVQLAITGTGLNAKERLFTSLAYLPKATVQAAIGGIPLSMGLACGETILSISVLAIMITAPLGALGMEMSYKKCLEHK